MSRLDDEIKCHFTDCRVIYNKNFINAVYQQSTSILIAKHLNNIPLEKYYIPVFSFIEDKPHYIIAIHSLTQIDFSKPTRKFVFEVQLPISMTEKDIITFLQNDNKTNIVFKVIDINYYEMCLCQDLAINSYWSDFQFALSQKQIPTTKDDRVLLISKKEDISCVCFIIEREKEGKIDRFFYEYNLASVTLLPDMNFDVEPKKKDDIETTTDKQEAQVPNNIERKQNNTNQNSKNKNIVLSSIKKCLSFPKSFTIACFSYLKALTIGYQKIDKDTHEKKP